MFIKYLGVTAFEHDIITFAEHDNNNRFIIESQRTGRLYGTSNLNTAMEKYNEFCKLAGEREKKYINF